MGGRHRIVLGRYQDAKLGAEGVVQCGSRSPNESCSLELTKLVNAFVARVRRRFGDKYAKVALAYIQGRHWSKTGIPKPTFYYALKKIEKTFDARKYWAKLHSARRRKARGLD